MRNRTRQPTSVRVRPPILRQQSENEQIINQLTNCRDSTHCYSHVNIP